MVNIKNICAVLVAATLLAACGGDGSGNSGDSTSAGDTSQSKLERGVDKVGQGLENAAEDVKQQLNESRIQSVLNNMKGMDGIDIELTDDGDVTLAGTVPSEEQKMEAERVVRGIKGVGTVTNALKVAGAPAHDTASGKVDTL